MWHGHTLYPLFRRRKFSIMTYAWISCHQLAESFQTLRLFFTTCMLLTTNASLLNLKTMHAGLLPRLVPAMLLCTMLKHAFLFSLCFHWCWKLFVRPTRELWVFLERLIEMLMDDYRGVYLYGKVCSRVSAYQGWMPHLHAAETTSLGIYCLWSCTC